MNTSTQSPSLENWTVDTLSEAYEELMEYVNPNIAYCLRNAYAVQLDGYTLRYIFTADTLAMYKMLNVRYNRLYMQEQLEKICKRAKAQIAVAYVSIDCADDNTRLR